MGFISFNEKYYRGKLDEYENKTLSDSDIYEAKQLLKVLDDLADEGYYSNISRNPFLEEIYRYCNWINREEDTAYIFLLRDALLPFVFFNVRNPYNVYPWLISRRFLEDITKKENVDDDIRLPLYEALESGRMDFDDFSVFCKDRILMVLDDHPELKAILLELLGSVRQNRIIVIESGYMGTVPMMLKALDNRVDFRLFTTAPFLYDTYQDKIFCRRYEDIRRFETVYSQDLFLQYSSYHNGKFYVKVSADKLVQDRALSEIKKFVV